MKHLALIGGGSRLMEIAIHLHHVGFAVTLLPELPERSAGGERRGPGTTFPPPGLALVSASQADELVALAAAAEHHGLPWLFLCDDTPENAGEELTTTAYRAGALAVLPTGSSAELVVQAVERASDSLTAQSGAGGGRPRRRHYRSGEAIPLRVDEMLSIVDGIVAQVVWHEDGGEGLVGLWGVGHLFSGHPEDDFAVTLRAHTDVVVEIDLLDAGVDAFERLLARVRHLEAWSSVQSRQNMQQRLLGVLSLLAEQFGEACSEGTLIDVRITHAQLAAAIGATRATVTRLLGPMRRKGLVSTVQSAAGERFCLPQWQSGHSLEVAGGLAATGR
ncbi:MAG: Crp/Fnr family transcriptional regulator [Thermoanaerobaculia bacterium]|nr:Crp/Fnr family transcriptional regulator [Thermoanaerobaculia bacterium]